CLALRRLLLLLLLGVSVVARGGAETRLVALGERAARAALSAGEQASDPRLQAEEAVHQKAERDRGAALFLLDLLGGAVVRLWLVVRLLGLVLGAVQAEAAGDCERQEAQRGGGCADHHISEAVQRAAREPGGAAQDGVTDHAAKPDRQRPGRRPWQ